MPGKDDQDISKYIPAETGAETAKGYVQFYADSPLDKKPIGEDVYLGLVNGAQKYIYFTTPYLIITDEMSRMMGLAAKRGVDVRIITPGITSIQAMSRMKANLFLFWNSSSVIRPRALTRSIMACG